MIVTMPPATWMTAEEVPVDERCWADCPVIAGPSQPCQNRGHGALGLCVEHAREILGAAAVAA